MSQAADVTGPLAAASDMKGAIDSHRWASSPLGEPSAWPQPLKTLVQVMLGSKQPMFIVWGAERTLLYNGGYAEILGNKHPHALGRDFLEVWHEIRADLTPIVQEAYAGHPVQMDDITLIVQRKGFAEETHFAFSYTPVHDESGKVGGFFCPCLETTEQVLADRRRAADAERQRRLFEQAPGFITILSGPEHHFEFANETYRRAFGEREYVGRTVRQAFPELEGQAFFELLDRVYTTGERFKADRLPIRFVGTSGRSEERFLDFIYEPVTDAGGHVTGIFVEGHDVTEATRAEELLRQSEARYRTLFESIDAGFCVVEMKFDGEERPIDYRLIEVNPAFEQLTGLHGAAGKWVSEAAPGLERHWFDSYGHVAKTGEPVRFENEAEPFGRYFDVHAFRIGAPEDQRVAILFNDISDRRTAELALRELNETLEQQVIERTAERDRMWETSPDLMGVVSSDGVLQRVNPAWTKLLGYTSDELVGHRLEEFVLPADHAATRDAYAGTGGRVAVENRYRRKDGSVCSVSWTAAPAGDLTYAIGRDVTAKRARDEELAAAEAARREADALYRAYFENTAEALFVVGVLPDGGFTVQDLNPAHQDSVGLRLEEVVGKRLDEVLPAETAKLAISHYAPVVATGQVRQYREAIELQGEMTYWDTILVPVTDETGRVVRLIGSSRDLTRQIAAEEQLRQSQKLEAMGQLTGGVAHDFNNLLTPIVGSLDMLARRGVGSEREQRLIGGALQSAERAKVLVQRLLAFARRQPLQATAVDIGMLIENMADLVASTTGPQIRVAVDVAEDLPPASAEPNQIEMALLNLAVNARDAMPNGGTLRISASAEKVEPGNAVGLKPGRFVQLSVADTGSGMDEATLARAVEPFFSTKGVGKGTGLGLSMAHGLASQLGGALTIQSRQGLGTNVQLWLPVSHAAIDVAGLTSDQDTPASAEGTALLVDDEDLVRMSTAAMLADLGYSVVEADSAERALDLVRDGLRPALLVTDHLMPGMNGTDLARSLIAQHPNLQVLIVSGYAESEGIAPDLPRLTKPFRIGELTRSLAALAT